MTAFSAWIPGLRSRSIDSQPVADETRNLRLCCGSVAVMAVLLYLPTLGFGFLNWDDGWYVVDNPLIRSWHPSNLYDIWTQVAIKNYAPLTLMAYLVQYTSWGLHAGGYHLVNALLHGLNAALVCLLVSRLTGNRFVGWVTAALFAVHPVQIESVAWISSQKGLWNATFTLASLLYWLKPERTERDEVRGLLWYVAALLTKALAVVVPIVVLTYDVLVRRERFGRALTRQLLPGFFGFCLLAVTMFAQETEFGGVRGHMELSKPEILALDATILWRYVGMLAWPANLSVLYDPPTTDIGLQVVLAIQAWILVGTWAYRRRTTRPLIPFALSTSLIFLLPVLNLFPITTLMNDRYLYLPSIPLFALFAVGVHRLASGLRNGRSPIPGVTGEALAPPRGMALRWFVAATLVTASAIATWRHLPVWKNPSSLWTHAMTTVPQLTVVRIQMAMTLHDAGRTDEAIATLQRALAETEPDRFDRERIERKLDDWTAASTAAVD